jgi:hypothetical protein
MSIPDCAEKLLKFDNFEKNAKTPQMLTPQFLNEDVISEDLQKAKSNSTEI